MKYLLTFVVTILLMSGCGSAEKEKGLKQPESTGVKTAVEDSLALAELEAKLVLKSMDNAIRDYQDADIELNKLWKQLKATLAESEMTALTKKQIAWIADKESSCKEVADQEFSEQKRNDLEKDPYWISVNQFCLAEKTVQRTAELKIILEKAMSADTSR